MQKDNVTYVHSHFASHPTSIARVVYLLTGIPYSFSAHAYDIWHDRLLLREKLREAKFVACCSACGKSELIKQGDVADAQKVRLIHHGIDTRRFKPAAQRPHPDNLILAVGRFESVKGFPLLVEACACLKQMGVPFKCCIVGDGDDKALAESLIRKHHLEDLVRLPGSVPQEQILEYYQRAAVFALPCIPSPDGRHDGIPNVVIEAMATGLPVVSTTIGGVPEVIDHGLTGFLVAPGDAKQLAEQLRAVLDDSSLRQRIGKAARDKVMEHFDNRVTIAPLVELLCMEAGLGAPFPPNRQ
jgi:glycosyltransferase involved in cell wall biosynthesis